MQPSKTTVETGYFGVPDGPRRGRSTKVHAVENGKPICGARIGLDMVYQWCARWVQWSYLECEHCKAAAVRRGLV
jgi:hypothetical protein